jgi:hypothetical protein
VNPSSMCKRSGDGSRPTDARDALDRCQRPLVPRSERSERSAPQCHWLKAVWCSPVLAARALIGGSIGRAGAHVYSNPGICRAQ